MLSLQAERHLPLPSQRTLLLWAFGARLVLAVGTLLAAAFISAERSDVSFIISLVVVFALVLTAYGAWRLFIEDAHAGPSFLYVQALVDIALVVALVHVMGPRGVFAALYVPVIAAYAVLMPLRGGVTVAALAMALFAADAVLGMRQAMDPVVVAQVLLFVAVFGLVAVLGSRVRAVGIERLAMASELQRARLEADDILRNIRAGVLTVDATRRLAFLNAPAERMLRLGGDAAVGQDVMELLQARAPELAGALEDGLRDGRRIDRGEGTVVLPGAEPFPIGLSTTVFQVEPTLPPSVTVVFSDISDLKRLASLQLRAERLEAVTALSAGLAHEIRNPLAAIRSATEQLARVAGADDDARVLATLIVRESDRLSRLLGEFLDFSRVRATHLTPIDLREVAEEAVRLVRAHPDCTPEATITVEGVAPPVEGDGDLLHRALSNLVLNAVQVCRGRPVRVAVRLSGATDEARGLVGGAEAARVVVADDGPGIPEEVQDRLFEPFVTARVGGSGLGLAIVQRAVEAHRGVILVDTGAGRGTTFTIYLPARSPHGSEAA